jgi:hypothetical protein
MKIQAAYAAIAAMAGIIAFGPAVVAHAQGSQGKTSGPAAGGNVVPQSDKDASGVSGPAGSKNGPAPRNAGDNVRSSTSGTAGSAAGVAGPAGSKNGPPAQRSGSNSPK